MCKVTITALPIRYTLTIDFSLSGSLLVVTGGMDHKRRWKEVKPESLFLAGLLDPPYMQ